MTLKRRKYKCPRTGKIKESPNWWMRFTVQGRETFTSTGTPDKNMAAMIEGAEIQRQQLEAIGAIKKDVQLKELAIADLLEEFEAHQQRRRTSERYRRDCMTRLGRIFERRSTWGDLSPIWIQKRLHALESQYDLSPQTVNEYRRTLHTLAEWLVKRGDLLANPVRGVEAYRRRDCKPLRPRRPLSHQELVQLVHTHEIDFTRRTVYMLAATSGLRRNEIESLKAGHFKPDRDMIVLPGEWTKNGEEARQPIPSTTARWLEEFVGRADELTPMFPRVPSNRTLYRDLERAEIRRETIDGRIDFHAFRYTYCVRLCLSGVPEWVAQQLMRHASSRVTREVYAKFAPQDKAAAAARIDLERDPSAPFAVHSGTASSASRPGLVLSRDMLCNSGTPGLPEQGSQESTTTEGAA